jgi:hypothetical protein
MRERFHSVGRTPIIWRIAYHVQMALWAILVGYVIFFLAFVVPNVPKAQSQAERLRAQEIAAEYKLYCEKWGMTEGTHAYTMCTHDLQQFREKVEKRMLDETEM